MSKFYLLTVAMCVLLCAQRLSAQEKISRTLTLDDMFRLATENSKQLKVSQTAIEQQSGLQM